MEISKIWFKIQKFDMHFAFYGIGKFTFSFKKTKIVSTLQKYTHTEQISPPPPKKKQNPNKFDDYMLVCMTRKILWYVLRVNKASCM